MVSIIERFLFLPTRLIGSFIGPRVLIIGIPKSGTHLILHVLKQIPFLTFYKNPIFGSFSTEKKKEMLKKSRNGLIIHGHLSFDESLADLIKELKLKTILMIRDPRDQIVSLAHYIVKISDKHRFGEYFTKVLTDDDSRLMACIKGVSGEHSRNKYPLFSLDIRYRSFLKWLEKGDIFLCRFEELIGKKGGGSDELQLESVRRVMGFLGIRLDDKNLTKIAGKAFSKNSGTFRKGQIGDWKNHLNQKHKEEIKRIAGNLLIELGYEKDLNW